MASQTIIRNTYSGVCIICGKCRCKVLCSDKIGFYLFLSICFLLHLEKPVDTSDGVCIFFINVLLYHYVYPLKIFIHLVNTKMYVVLV